MYKVNYFDDAVKKADDLVKGGGIGHTAKIMWVMYEHPEIDFMDLAS